MFRSQLCDLVSIKPTFAYNLQSFVDSITVSYLFYSSFLYFLVRSLTVCSQNGHDPNEHAGYDRQLALEEQERHSLGENLV